MSVIAVWSPVDLVLSLVVPLGLAVHKGTALVVDLDPSGPPLPGRGDLASLVHRGPTEAELSPTGKGVAVLANGGIDGRDSREVIAALAKRWPHVVLRCAPAGMPPSGAVPVLPVLPAPFTVSLDRPAVYQRTHLGGEPDRGVIVLPTPKPGTVRTLLEGRTPARKDTWIRSLEQVWTLT